MECLISIPSHLAPHNFLQGAIEVPCVPPEAAGLVGGDHVSAATEAGSVGGGRDSGGGADRIAPQRTQA